VLLEGQLCLKIRDVGERYAGHMALRRASATDTRRGSRFARAFRRFTSDDTELEAEELREDVKEEGATPVVACCDRERVKVVGTLRSVTLRPRAGVPALEAELWDGSASVGLIWLGRRQIPGIEPGRRLSAEGLVQVMGDARVIFNPRYVLKPAGAE
jgi:hypothetical protein